MSNAIRHYAGTLKKLNKYSDKEKKKWLKIHLDKNFVHCVCECAKNILKGNVPLSKGQKIKLKQRRSKLRQLVKRKVSLKKKKAIIQSGGFLGAILGPIVSILSGLFGGNAQR